MPWGTMTGPKGDKGDIGPQGVQGPQGIQGPKGDKGDPGEVYSVNGQKGAVEIPVFSGKYEDLTNKPNASKIPITDQSNLFTSTNVEGALSELFIDVSNGKNQVATAITDKGVNTSGSDSFQTMADNILSLYVIEPDDTTPTPGGKILVAGDMDAGYFGTVTSDDFVTGDTLASICGFSIGTTQNANTDWLKLSYEGNILFSPLKSIRYDVGWNALNDANLVYGDKQVIINGLKYKVRLFKGANVDPPPISDIQNAESGITVGSEWDKLILPLHENAPNDWAYISAITNDWEIGLTDTDFGVMAIGNGDSIICQERTNDLFGYTRMVTRGNTSIDRINDGNPKGSIYAGWKPVLVFVP